MSERPLAGIDLLPPGEGRRVDLLCDRFEANWKSGRRPRLERYLGRVPPAVRPVLLRELLGLELEYRRRRGETPAPEDYRGRFPEQAALITAAFSEEAAPPGPQPLLVQWAVSCLARQAQRRDVAGADSAAYPAPPVGLWSQLLRLAPADPVGTPEEEPLTVVNSQGSSALREPERGAAPRTVPDATPPHAGPVLGEYELLDKLGKGGMGIVYRARHQALNRIVALKVIRPDRLEDLPPPKRQEWLDRFRQEARAAARSEHAHIVTVYDVGEIDGQLYYAMQYVEGCSLAEIVRAGPLPNRRAAAYLEPVARAVHHIHTCGVLHRDLKPRNILVDRDDRPLLTDFGLAKWQESVQDTMPTRGPLGTPSYTAPEQVRLPARISTASDVYSLGATLYDLLTGRPPFQAADPLETLRQVRDEEPVAPRQLNPAIDRDLELICLRCLQKEPHRRYASALQLADELRRYLRGEPLVYTRPVGRAERLWRWRRRNPALATAGGLAAAGLVAVAVVSGAFAVHWFHTADQLRQKQADTTAALTESQRLAATLALDRGLGLCEQEQVGPGLVWLAHSLELVPAGAEDLERTIRVNLAGWLRQVWPLRAPSLQHQGPVYAVAFSPDGRTVLTGSGDGALHLWEAATGKELRQFKGHDRAVETLAFSPDGQTALSGGVDKTARLWDVATGKELHQLEGQEGLLWAVAFSPDGKTALTTTLGGKTARLWDVATGGEIHRLEGHTQDIRAVTFSPDGKSVLGGSSDGTIHLWDAPTGNTLLRFQGHTSAVRSVAFSPDGSTVLTGSADKTARLWQAATGKPIGAPLQHEGAVHAVAFHPDGKAVLTGSADRRARLWNVATGNLLGPLLPHHDAVLAVAFSADGNTVLTGSRDRRARLWEAAREPVGDRAFAHEERVVTAVAFSPDGSTLLTGSGDPKKPSGAGAARLWNVATGKLLFPALRHEGMVNRVAFSPDGRTIVTGSADHTARLWDVATGQPIGRPLVHKNWVFAVAFSPDGKTVATASTDGNVQFWDARTGTPGPILPHPDSVRVVAYSQDGRTVLTAGDHGLAHLWEAATGQELHWFFGHRAAVRDAAFSPDGRTVVTASHDGTAQLWEAATGNRLGGPLPHADRVDRVRFSPDGRTVVTGSHDGTACLWKVATGELLGSPLPHQGRVWALAFSPDSKTVLTGSVDQTARFWDAVTGKPLGPSLKHGAEVWAVAFNPDGRTVVTGAEDHTARLWKAPAPLPGAGRRVVLWTRLITGLELQAGDTVRELDARRWQQYRQELHELGGPP
jgi:WD40 repeat protein/tRNA A-37 threonylcarbamoyl transferase component Bud32